MSNMAYKVGTRRRNTMMYHVRALAETDWTMYSGVDNG